MLYGTAVEVQIVLHRVKQGEKPETAYDLTELADIFLLLTKIGHRSAGSCLVNVPDEQMLDFNSLKRIFKNQKYREVVSYKSREEIIKEDGLQKDLLSNGGCKNEDRHMHSVLDENQ